ncbi:hypothetical protein THRCLA_20457 [Thraustotheca clavata]|uniref:Transmembrane protein n=1 Tax=Thraustotheca clavata TaxID=74557 RepID=A0A1W0A6X8_9STRA|nr:hypothetical protein THRCLA_20457 [Thraustotheca clavata]
MSSRGTWQSMRRPVLLRPDVRSRQGPQSSSWSKWDLLLWPIQVTTYRIIVYAISYIFMTLLLGAGVISLGILAIALIPLAFIRFILHLFCCPTRRYYPNSILYKGFRVLVRWDVVVHNRIAQQKIPLYFDANADEIARLLESHQPHFIVRICEDWNCRRVLKYVVYVFIVRSLLVCAILQWCDLISLSMVAFLDIIFVLFFPQVDCTFSFLWGLDTPISCSEHFLGLLGCAIILWTVFVSSRQPLCNLLCYVTRYFCCESFVVLRG